MKNLIIIVLILIIFYEELSSRCFEFFNTTFVKSNIDNNQYRVLSTYEDAQKASDIMGEINMFAINLITKLKKKYVDSDIPGNLENNIKNKLQYEKGRELTIRLLRNFRSENLQENEPESPNKTSYTKDKSIIALCLREKDSGKNDLHDTEVLKFVFLHELAHMATTELSHSKTFWTNFKFLLEFSELNNLYKTPDFEKTPKRYCSTNITYNPVSDKNLKSYFH